MVLETFALDYNDQQMEVYEYVQSHTEWRPKCHTIDCTHNTFLSLQNRSTSGTELILIGWKIVPNESL